MSTVPRLTGPSWSRRLIAIGFIPLPRFLILTTAGGFFAPGYNPVSQHVSELGLIGGVPAALMRIAAVASGLGFCLFAIGFWRLGDRRVAFGAIAWLVFGTSLISNGIWMLGSPLHGLYNIGLLNVAAPALSLVENQRLASNSLVFAATIIASFAATFYVWLNINGLDPGRWHGLTQRLFSTINSGWPAVTAVALALDARRHAPGDPDQSGAPLSSLSSASFTSDC